MSISRNETVSCAQCGRSFEIRVFDSINAGRHPHLREALMERRLHVFRCEACQATFVVEKPLLYFDFDRRQFVGMFPRRDWAREHECAQELMSAFETTLRRDAPEGVIAYAEDFLVRACFGYEELREKIAIDEAALSDLAVEALKGEMMAAQADLFREAKVATLRFDFIGDEGELVMFAEWLPGGGPPANAEPPRFSISRDTYEAMHARGDEDLLATHPGIASGPVCSVLRLMSATSAIQ